MANDVSMTAGFDVGAMILLLSEAAELIPRDNDRAAGWLMDYADWQRREDARLADDEPLEHLDLPERQEEPTVQSCVAERDQGWKAARDQHEKLRRNPDYYKAKDRTAQLGQAHYDVHAAWNQLGFAEGIRDAMHRVYGYPRGDRA